MKSPTRLDLLIEKRSKRDAFALATKGGISMSRLFEILIAAEKKRTDGEVPVLPTTPGVKVPAAT